MLFWKVRVKRLSGRKRDIAKSRQVVLTGRNVNDAHDYMQIIRDINKLFREAFRLVNARKIGKSVLRRLHRANKFFFLLWLNEMTTEIDVINSVIPIEHHGLSITFDRLATILPDRISTHFRFHSIGDLRRLYYGLQFPNELAADDRQIFTGVEVFLFGIYRLAHLETYRSEGIRAIFGFKGHSRGTKCFKVFLQFMVQNWGYLLTNNMDFWLPYLPDCANRIREKANEKQPGVNFPETFAIFGFIDNTMNASCRPGGGPRRDGADAPRNDMLIQRAFYNGWKKLHGIKWQTVDLPNGMNFHVWGPVSLRHNDLFTLEHSEVNNQLSAVQVGQPQQFMIYGDSAYVVINESHIRARHSYDDNTEQEIMENRALSSCREEIEWDYGDVGRYFPLVDYSKILKLRKMPVSAMYLTAMILRNALNCFAPGVSSQYFHCNPPSIEEWLAQGLQARPHVVAQFL